MKIPNLKPAKKLLYKIKELSKSLSRKIRGSNNWYKAKRKLSNLYEKIQNQRRDYTHKLSHFLVTYFDQIAIENTDNQVVNIFLRGHWNDNNSYELIRELEYKSDWYDREFVKVDPRNTSKTCNICGYVKDDLRLDDKLWFCPVCQVEHDRDVNAALNIEKIAFEGRNCPSEGTPLFELS
ncbi:MAG: transposase [Candidatus Methanofastidiosa archaeon]|nr:transposase [Candidatus Methanofastidiosa archaeon]